MKKWIKLIIIIIAIVVLFYVGVEVTYYFMTGGIDCCSCCSDSAEFCISACCECNYNIIEKIEFIFNK